MNVREKDEQLETEEVNKLGDLLSSRKKLLAEKVALEDRIDKINRAVCDSVSKRVESKLDKNRTITIDIGDHAVTGKIFAWGAGDNCHVAVTIGYLKGTVSHGLEETLKVVEARLLGIIKSEDESGKMEITSYEAGSPTVITATTTRTKYFK